MTDQEHEDYADRMELHTKQVAAGLIPEDSPPDFVRPEGTEAVDDHGRPWWFGKSYKPTAIALERSQWRKGVA
jgi:hypothetical protein